MGNPTFELKRSPFGGIPRNWKLQPLDGIRVRGLLVPPSGGSLEIGNVHTILPPVVPGLPG